MPKKILELHGSWRAKHRPDEPKLAAGIPPRPKFLSDVARAEFDRAAEILMASGILSQVDGAALALYAQSYADWQEAEAQLAKNGLVITSSKGQPMASPWVGIRNKSAALMLQAAAALGMTPTDRAKIKFVDLPAGEVESPLEKVLNQDVG